LLQKDKRQQLKLATDKLRRYLAEEVLRQLPQ
jgi:hypothetical protein